MKSFEFEIVETLVVTAIIKAESAEDAREKLENAYKNEDIVLDASDWVDTQINLVEGEF